MLKKFRAYARSFFQDKMIYTEKTIEQIDRRYVLRELTTEDIKELLDVEREVSVSYTHLTLPTTVLQV